MSRVVFLNGRFVPEPQACISIYDSGVVMGDMAYEVTRTFRHQPFRLRHHLQRLAHSLAVLRIDAGLGLDELERATLETLARNLPAEPPDVDWNIIHNVSRGPAAGFLEAFTPEQRRPTVAISCFPLTHKLAALAPWYESGLDLVVPAQRSVPHELVDTSIKTRSRWPFQLANFQAQDQLAGATAVLIDPDGFLTEGTTTNVFLVRHGELLTPTARNILPGVTRGLLLELAGRLGVTHREMDLTVDDALAADEMFVCSTSIGILHGRTFQGLRIGGGAAGPLTLRLRRALDEEVGLDFAAQARAYAARRAAP